MAEKLPRMMERKYWIDWAKVFGIYMVVLGHFLDGNECVRQWLYSFHVPFFFIISGYLDKSETHFDFHLTFTKLFKRLLVPYLVFGIVAQMVVFLQESNCQQFVWGGVKLILGRPSLFALPMWFVFTMFEVKLLYSYLVSVARKIKNATCLIVVLVIICLIVIDHFGISFPWALNFFVAYPFYWAGTLIRKKNNLIVWMQQNSLSRVFVYIIVCLLPMASVRLNGNVDMFARNFGNSVLLYYLFSIAISYCVLLAFKALFNFKSKLIMKISEGTILILALHMLIIKQLSTFVIPIYMKAVICLFIVAAFYYPIVFCQKYCPILIGKKRSN